MMAQHIPVPTDSVQEHIREASMTGLIKHVLAKSMILWPDVIPNPATDATRDQPTSSAT